MSTFSQQAAAVERAAVNWRGHVNNLRDLAERGDARHRERSTQSLMWGRE